jgi:hypothetical protein
MQDSKKIKLNKIGSLEFQDFEARVSFHIERILKRRINDVDELKAYLTKFEDAYVISDICFNDQVISWIRKPEIAFQTCLYHVMALLNPALDILQGEAARALFQKTDFTSDVKCSLLLMAVATMRGVYLDALGLHIETIICRDLTEGRYFALYPLAKVMFTRKAHLILLTHALENLVKPENDLWGMIGLTLVSDSLRETAITLYKSDKAFMETVNSTVNEVSRLLERD